VTTWWAELAWLGPEAGAADAPGDGARAVLIEVSEGRITSVATGMEPPAGATRLPGLTIPGLANAHSHAFHRALRGRTHGGAGDFWAWRERMYAVADRLDPDTYLALATAAYAEMALAGITAVGEFHYLHHQPGGKPYADPNELGLACIAAAAAAGLRITLLDTCYLRGGLDDRPLAGPQVRFGDGTAGAWAERASALAEAVPPEVRVGAAIHSVRAVAPAELGTVAAWAADHEVPLHLHLSEQPAENADCLAVTGRTPTALLADAGALGPGTTAVHATHLTPADLDQLARSGTGVCLCPTTERDLADGTAQARAMADASIPLSLGSDSHAVVDLFEEARGVELDERLATGRRGLHRPAALLSAATAGGMAALGRPEGGRIRPGAPADFVTLDLTSPRLAGTRPADAVAAAVYAATAADVSEVVVAGRRIVSGGRHLLVPDVGAALATAIAALEEAG
jgi:formiminoglutamate deiminase